MSRTEQNTAYQETLRLSKITSPQSLYLTGGGLSWIYLLYFTGRTAFNARSMSAETLSRAITEQPAVRRCTSAA